ncbi:hypothetical protein [Zhongshania sp.]|uniref:hypothetical protein n=1 Tax=Zhongshania sp. TaxID=1971902 RepID=UPI003563EB2C
MRKLLIFFAAGCVGALVNSLAIWLLGDHGITTRLGIAIAPNLSPSWLYPRIVWGGLWGLLFILPMLASRPFSKGLLLSLLPTAVQLFVVFPQAQKGYGGLELGLYTPALVLFVNGIWGATTALTIRYAR